MVKDFLNGFLALVKGKGASWGFEERRSLVRLKCSYRSIYSHGENRLPGTITDLGEGGLALTTPDPLKVGQTLKVYCPFVDVDGPNEPIEGEVCWTRELGGLHNSGLRFQVTPHSWVFSVLQLLGFSSLSSRSKRRWVRAECKLPARIGSREVQVENLGVGGALVQTKPRLTPAEGTITIGPYLKLEALELSGSLGEPREDGLQAFEFRELDAPQLKLLGLYLKALLRRSFA
ncbi:MAG: PilZ domain-containing protein [Candidatus Eremiobacteraeota bacterium]|nr:PilZ domain-containing protein [Candidatus Eremiobacteraeota bacterium]